MDIYTCLDELIVYAQNRLLLDDLDVVYARNSVLALIGLKEYKEGTPDEDKAFEMETPDELLNNFTKACISANVIKAEDAQRVADRTIKVLAMNPSRVNDMYVELGGKGNARAEKFLQDYAKACKFGTSHNPAFKEEITEDGFMVTAVNNGEYELAPVYSAVDELVYYAENALLLDTYDIDFAKRAICDIIGLNTYSEQEIDYEKVDALDRPDVLIATLRIAVVYAGLISDEDAMAFSDMIMGALSLRPSEINDLFNGLAPKKAMEFLYDYSVKNYYIKKTALENNVRFKSDYTKGGLELTINKARPEYVNASSAVKGNTPAGGYPQCSICAENEGNVATGKSGLRTISLSLGGEEWFWQFSPYGYLGKHGIAVNKKHVPMKVTDKTVVRLMDFVDRFPTFFLGTNAALPGAGGSVLAHDHYQGGDEMLPMHKAKCAVKLTYPKYPLADIEVLDWYDSVVRITSQSRQVITEIEEDIRKGWENYTDKERGIIAKDGDGTHNGVSLTMRKIGNGRYCLDIILRSNLPEFLTHPEYQVLKKESIGLLEAQGLFILPGRLEAQMSTLNDCLVNKTELPQEMSDFKQIHHEIIKENGKEMSKVEASIYIKAEFGSICERILGNVAVFKTPEEMADFLVSLGTFAR